MSIFTQLSAVLSEINESAPKTTENKSELEREALFFTYQVYLSLAFRFRSGIDLKGKF
jgi:hypothetical protein